MLKINKKIQEYKIQTAYILCALMISCASNNQTSGKSNKISPTPKCDISIAVDSTKVTQKDGNSIYFDIYWKATGYSDSCYAQKPICVDWSCEEFHKKNVDESLRFVNPKSSMEIKIYGDDNLILKRDGFFSSMLPTWEMRKADTIFGIERFVQSKGIVDSVRIIYRPFDSAYIQ